ncbi:OmpA family protein [Shewanella dokdonensis]|uniref:OmpA family protein n=1 Tax=Shewanella dokdonensis TaxID=712036 RepID=A0ABX8DFQ0_9GAMM|nr:OmpA family protein [Shewanella dokdonensis]MCL1076049.1 OmpA family protein [Shewanella dokdonensis]QVK23210.1 OmpA family protein [Shewanella dokdonensis]
MWRRLLLLSWLAVLPLNASAELRHYVASLDQSQWRLLQNSPVACTLEHDIPSYGRAVFTSRAGKDINLQFTLDMWQKPDSVTNAKLLSKAPMWRPGVMSRTIMELHYQKYFNGEVPKKAAWTMLNELERGMEPTFYYTDWNDRDSTVAVGLSAVNFRGEYADFKQCLAKLLPYSFDDIAFTVLTYETGGTELTRSSKAQLARVEQYLTYDPDVELVLIDGYTDSYGGRSINQKVSEKRADSLRELFVAKGIAADRIHAVGHGERRHVALNSSASERERNRRVVIRMSKPEE